MMKAMKKIYYLLAAGVLAIAASCQKPQFVEPTAERQGITSLTAFFTSGKYVEKEMGRLVVPEGESPEYGTLGKQQAQAVLHIRG